MIWVPCKSIEHETPKALLIDFGDGKPVWIPRSQTRARGKDKIELANWLAEKHKLVETGEEEDERWLGLGDWIGQG